MYHLIIFGERYKLWNSLIWNISNILFCAFRSTKCKTAGYSEKLSGTFLTQNPEHLQKNTIYSSIQPYARSKVNWGINLTYCAGWSCRLHSSVVVADEYRAFSRMITSSNKYENCFGSSHRKSHINFVWQNLFLHGKKSEIQHNLQSTYTILIRFNKDIYFLGIGRACLDLQNLALSNIAEYEPVGQPCDEWFNQLHALELWSDPHADLSPYMIRQLLLFSPNMTNMLFKGCEVLSDKLMTGIWEVCINFLLHAAKKLFPR